MESLWAGNRKLGPYSDAAAKHQFVQSRFHRDVDYCGTCHDVSNPAVGDPAHNNGTQPTGDPVITSGVLGSPVDRKAAFNNFPYQYGIAERTYVLTAWNDCNANGVLGMEDTESAVSNQASATAQ